MNYLFMQQENSCNIETTYKLNKNILLEYVFSQFHQFLLTYSEGDSVSEL